MAGQRWWHEIVEGLDQIRRHEVLSRSVIAIALANIEWFAAQAILVVYATKELGLSPALLGLSLAASGPFSVLGAAIATPLTIRWGVGPVMIGGLVLEAISRMLLPFAGGGEIQAAAVLILTQALIGLTVPLWSVGYVTLQQAVTPDRLLGRVTSALNFVQFGVAPPAAFGAGVLADVIGIRPTLLIAGVIAVIAVVYIAWSPVRRFRDVPSTPTFTEPALHET
jgi:predicted MFS family arabinose efflux permease